MKQPTVVVTGSAEQKVDPDRFAMTARIQVRAADSSAAHAGLAQRFTSLDQAVMALGSDDIEIQRSPVDSYGEGGRLQRWWAGRSLTVVCRDTSRAAEVAGTFGRVADVQVDGPHWMVDRANAAFADVQAEAVRDARERAERYAAALGGELGRLVELRDGEFGGRFDMGIAPISARVSDEPGLETLDLSPQPQHINASVQTRWYLVLPS